MKTPDLRPRKMALELEYVNHLLGVDLTAAEAKSLLEKMRFEASVGKKDLNVLVPAYRTDVLHPMDLVEDIAIAYGYERFKPELPKISTVGKKDGVESFASSIRELMLGFGFSEIMTLIMTNEKDLFDRMQAPRGPTVATKNPVSVEHSIARTWLLPSVMAVLEKNKNREYPQRIFELGYCITAEGKEERKLSGAVAHAKTNFSEIKSICQGLMESVGVVSEPRPAEHPSFIAGRCASTEYGFFGEIHPQVLEGFDLETPVTAFELDVEKILAAVL